MRKVPARPATNENVAFEPGESAGVEAPGNAGVTVSAPLTIAHECAHNMTPLHDSQHEFWTSSIIETLMEPFVRLLATSR